MTDVTDEPFRVIVVEDDEDVALYVQTILHRRLPCEVKVLASADGYEALESEFDPDVVITDLELPGRGGFELLGDIRARRSDLAVVIMTAHAGGEYAERARREAAVVEGLGRDRRTSRARPSRASRCGMILG